MLGGLLDWQPQRLPVDYYVQGGRKGLVQGNKEPLCSRPWECIGSLLRPLKSWAHSPRGGGPARGWGSGAGGLEQPLGAAPGSELPPGTLRPPLGWIPPSPQSGSSQPVSVSCPLSPRGLHPLHLHSQTSEATHITHMLSVSLSLPPSLQVPQPSLPSPAAMCPGTGVQAQQTSGGPLTSAGLAFGACTS